MFPNLPNPLSGKIVQDVKIVTWTCASCLLLVGVSVQRCCRSELLCRTVVVVRGPRDKLG